MTSAHSTPRTEYRARLGGGAALLLLGASVLAPARAVRAETRLASADGLSIAYDVAGAGATTLVFIHCWACDRSFWRNQFEFFKPSYRVVSLDLGGHGTSRGHRESWTVLGLAQDVKAVVESLDLKRVILIGHSMGGPVALESAHILKGRIAGVVLVDTVQNAEEGPTQDQAEQIAVRLEKDFKGAMGEFAQGAFAPGANPATIALVSQKAGTADPSVAMALLRDFPTLDLPALLRGAGVPVRGINTVPPMGPETAVAINRKYADYDAVLMEHAGHFLMLERPQEFDRLLDKVVRDLRGKDRAW